MTHQKAHSLAVAKAAILALAEIKSAAEAFDRGEINAFDAVDAIEAALDACREASSPRRSAA